MTTAEALDDGPLRLRCLQEADVSAAYVAWLNDPAVNRYLEVRFATHTLESTREFVRGVNASPDAILFGMFVDEGRRHIGNIKLGPVNRHHRRADIGLMIGDRREWGKGHAPAAIRLVTDYGFRVLGLAKVTAGCYGANVGSLRAFEKVGYVLEARLPGHWQTPEGPDDELLLGITPAAFAAARPEPRRFGFVRRLVVIGGGDLMLEVGQRARALGYAVDVVLAPRHAEETLPLDGRPALPAWREAGFTPAVVADLNAPGALAAATPAGADALALCFGPAWVFSAPVIAAFGAGMVNFNGIPIPHYLGGAHYTWQILNGSRQGGCFLQAITTRLDRGDILRAEIFDLPAEVTTPQDYFVANHRAGVAFLGRALEDFRADRAFAPVPFSRVDPRRLYFPRLLTKHNAYIDWAWSGADIARFCQAFDEPYLGAASFWEGQEVRLKRVALEAGEPAPMHPYVSGLVVRRHGGRIWIGTTSGLLRVEAVRDAEARDVLTRVREGQRFSTPPEVLERARTFRPVITSK